MSTVTGKLPRPDAASAATKGRVNQSRLTLLFLRTVTQLFKSDLDRQTQLWPHQMRSGRERTLAVRDMERGWGDRVQKKKKRYTIKMHLSTESRPAVMV